MEKVTAIIVDDEEKGISLLTEMLRKLCSNISVIGTCRSADEAASAIEKLKPQLVFLDISMPGKGAFEMLAGMKIIDFEIIFITAHSGYSLQAFRYSAIDYLLKPVDEDLLQEAVGKATQRISSNLLNEKMEILLHNIKQQGEARNIKICIASIKGFVALHINEILYCKAEGCYTKFHLVNNKVITSSRTLAAYEELLSDSNFFRVHKTYLVNLDHFKEYHKRDGGKLILNNGVEIEVSRRKKDDFLKRIKILFKI